MNSSDINIYFMTLTIAIKVSPYSRLIVGPVNVGVVNVTFGEKQRYRPNFTIEETFIHPNRDKKFLTNDLAVIKLFWPLEFSRNIQPISIGNLTMDRLHENETVKILNT